MPWKLPLFLPAACGAAPGQSCPGAPCPHSGVLGQSSAPSGQAAWLFLAVVPGVASLLLFNALGAPGLAAPLPFPNTSPSFPCSAEFGGVWGSRLPPGSTGGTLRAGGGPCSPRCSPSQWLDRGAVRAAREPGRGHHHDGGGGVLHALRRPLALPPQAGEFLAGLGAAQAPCGASLDGIAWPGGVPQADIFPPCSLPQVHSLYRRTGASFQRAQEEFSQGILTNRSFQNAAAGAASSAAHGAFRGN